MSFDLFIQDIDLVHCRISSIPALKLENFTKLEVSKAYLGVFGPFKT